MLIFKIVNIYKDPKINSNNHIPIYLSIISGGGVEEGGWWQWNRRGGPAMLPLLLLSQVIHIIFSPVIKSSLHYLVLRFKSSPTAYMSQWYCHPHFISNIINQPLFWLHKILSCPIICLFIRVLVIKLSHTGPHKLSPTPKVIQIGTTWNVDILPKALQKQNKVLNLCSRWGPLETWKYCQRPNMEGDNLLNLCSRWGPLEMGIYC